MKSIGRVTSFVILLLAVLFTAGSSKPVAAAITDDSDTGGRPIFVELIGAEEAPGPGDPDGTGTAFFTLNQGQDQVCYELTAVNIDPATAAHIHRAPAGVAGGVVIPLVAPNSGFSSGCVTVDPELIKEIRQFPTRFYVNVHNPAFPAGAIRGQLGE